jgi:hypothetical protein
MCMFICQTNTDIQIDRHVEPFFQYLSVNCSYVQMNHHFFQINCKVHIGRIGVQRFVKLCSEKKRSFLFLYNLYYHSTESQPCLGDEERSEQAKL